tara:strand:- start:39 stop:401 length:363 start_codon:yes stop_codon:yes gene_type:complete
MPRIRENYTVMSITIDPKLKEWIQRSESSASAVVESIIRRAYLQAKGERRAKNAYRQSILDPKYTYQPGLQKHLNAIELAKTMLRELQRTESSTDIKSERSRMLRYELAKFVQEGAPNGE